MHPPTLPHASHVWIGSKLPSHSLGNIADQDLNFLKEICNRRLVGLGGRLRSLLFSVLQKCCDGFAKCLNLPPDSLFPRSRLGVTPDQLENQRGDCILLVRGVLELRKRPGSSLVKRNAEGNPDYSVVGGELALRDAGLVKNPWTVQAVCSKQGHHVCGVVELLHNGPIPFLPVLDACGPFAV